jgi:hypothetical protein
MPTYFPSTDSAEEARSNYEFAQEYGDLGAGIEAHNPTAAAVSAVFRMSDTCYAEDEDLWLYDGKTLYHAYIECISVSMMLAGDVEEW